MTDASTDTQKESNKKMDKQAKKASESKTVNTSEAASASVEPSANLEPSADIKVQQPTANIAQEPPAPAKGSGKGLSVFAILLSLLALAGTGFTWYQTQLSKVASNTSLAVGVTEIGGQVSRIGDSIKQLQKTQAGLVSQEELTTRILESNVAADSKFRDLNSAQSDINESLEKLNADLQKGVNEFVIDEVSQLLKLANNSAIFSNDSASAISALTLADIQLKELADPRYSIVRRKINAEIELLQNVKQVDAEKVTAQITTIVNKIPTLKLANEPPAKERIQLVAESATEQTTTWRTELNKIWKDIINSVQIQRVDQPPKPLLAPTQRYFLDQNIQLSLNKAELALLQKNSGVYLQSLGSAGQWLNDYFDLKDQDVQLVMQQLSALKSEPVGVEMPAIADSYDTLQSIKGGQ